MDLGFDESQQMLKSSARAFLEQECPSSMVRALEEDPRGYTLEIWRKMADLGWLGLPFPQQFGGMDLSYFDLVILLEEMGRVLLPGPFFSTVVLGGLTLLDCADESVKADLIPKICAGELIMTLALVAFFSA